MRIRRITLINLITMVIMLQGCSSGMAYNGTGVENDVKDIDALKYENEMLEQRNTELLAQVTLLENNGKDIENLQEKISLLSNKIEALSSITDETSDASFITPNYLLDYAYTVLSLYSAKNPDATRDYYGNLNGSSCYKKNSNIRTFIDASLDFWAGAYTDAYIELPDGLYYKSFYRTSSSQHGIYTYSSTSVCNVYWNQEYVRVERYSASTEVKQIDTLEVYVEEEGLVIHRFSDYRDENTRKNDEDLYGIQGCLFYYDFLASQLSFMDYTKDTNWNNQIDVRNLQFDYVFDYEDCPNRIFNGR